MAARPSGFESPLPHHSTRAFGPRSWQALPRPESSGAPSERSESRGQSPLHRTTRTSEHLARLSTTMSSSSDALGLYAALWRQHVLRGAHGQCRIPSSLAQNRAGCPIYCRSDPSRSRLPRRTPNHRRCNRSRAAVETLECGEEGRSHLARRRKAKRVEQAPPPEAGRCEHPREAAEADRASASLITPSGAPPATAPRCQAPHDVTLAAWGQSHRTRAGDVRSIAARTVRADQQARVRSSALD